MAQTGQAHRWNDRSMGRPKMVNQQYLGRLKELVSHSPREYGYPFECWTAQWLSKHLAKELHIEVSDRYINYLLRDMGLSTRQRRDAVKATDSTKDSGITIDELQSSSSPDGLLPFNFIETSN